MTTLRGRILTAVFGAIARRLGRIHDHFHPRTDPWCDMCLDRESGGVGW